MKIAMLGACPYPVPQGSQVYLRETALALRDRGHEIHLVVYGYGIGTDVTGLRIHRAPNLPGVRKTSAGPSFAKPLLDAALAQTLRRVVRENAIEAIGAHNYEALLVALAARAAPVVYHAHNAMNDELPHYFPGLPGPKRIGVWLDRTFPKRANSVIVPHTRLHRYLLSVGCKDERLAVVQPPIDSKGFEQANRNDATAPTVLYTGNLDAYQNLPLLEKAMAKVRDEEGDTRFLVATSAKGKVQGAEFVQTPDFDALRDVLAQDAVFVCPRTSWSGYPIKLLNAMAAALPIVCCEGSAHPLQDGVTGIVVPNNDIEAFANAVLGLLRDRAQRERLGAAARATVLALHDPVRVGEQLEAVYRAATSRDEPT